MAAKDHNAPHLFPNRFVTIRESFRYNRDTVSPTGRRQFELTTFPSMRISGKWLEAAGFEPPQRVKIEVTSGRLILTPIPEEECDHLGRDGFPITDSLTGLRRRHRYQGRRKASESTE
ncbi:SymE family type I addiction module toxin [Burkholderia plantarii]|uniref:SymE family type I addiction module toxin n=1 Tax=Burkholderia plantarii TaxID=41899 RepID=UPI0018DD082C|nr:SymE family type I addiction module toxin [Burkholderia plantarii]MBI0325477.1 SymE family type I addiction module toxin [Burkholderia plantarii]